MKDESKTKKELITELKRLRRRVAKPETAPRDAEEKLAQKYLEVAGGIFVVIGPDERVLQINRKGCELLGRTEEGVKGRNWFDEFIPAGLREEVRKVFRKIMAGEVAPFEYHENPVLSASGAERVIAWQNTVLRDSSGNIQATLSSGADITDLKRAFSELESHKNGLESLVRARTRELEEANSLLTTEVSERKRAEGELRKFASAIEQGLNIVLITSPSGSVEYLNPMFAKVTGLPVGGSLGRPITELVHPESTEELKTAISGASAGAPWSGMLRCLKKGGHFWAEASVSPLKDGEGRISNILFVLEDVTEKKTSLEKMEYLARFDPTTGLTNRARFIELLNSWMGDPDNSGRTGALLLLDLDQFKFISDTYGHGMGDEFLRRVARLLQVTLRYLDWVFRKDGESMLCRLSGDEFAVFVPGVERVDAVAIAEQVRIGVEGFYQADVPCHMTASIGVALYPEHGATTTELLTRADAAMYRAKDLGSIGSTSIPPRSARSSRCTRGSPGRRAYSGPCGTTGSSRGSSQ